MDGHLGPRRPDAARLWRSRLHVDGLLTRSSSLAVLMLPLEILNAEIYPIAKMSGILTIQNPKCKPKLTHHRTTKPNMEGRQETRLLRSNTPPQICKQSPRTGIVFPDPDNRMMI